MWATVVYSQCGIVYRQQRQLASHAWLCSPIMHGVVTWPWVDLYGLFFCVSVDLCNHTVIENLCAANEDVFFVLSEFWPKYVCWWHPGQWQIVKSANHLRAGSGIKWSNLNQILDFVKVEEHRTNIGFVTIQNAKTIRHRLCIKYLTSDTKQQEAMNINRLSS